MKGVSGQVGRLGALALIGASFGAVAWVGWERFALFGHHRPVTIEYETSPRNPSETKTHYTIFYRADGARVEANSYDPDENGPFPNIRSIELPLEKRRVAVDSSRNLVAVSKVPAPVADGDLRAAPFWNTAVSCRQQMLINFPGAFNIVCERMTSRYLGFSVWRAKADIHAGPETLHVDELLAPDLGWRWVRLVMTKENGEMTGNVQASRIWPGEPAAALFEVPKTARVVSVKELFRGVTGQSSPKPD